MFKPKTLGLWANTDKSNFWEILPKIMDWSEQKDIQIYVTEKIQSHKNFIFDDAPKIDSSGKISEIDFMLVLGGDGKQDEIKIIIVYFESIFYFPHQRSGLEF